METWLWIVIGISIAILLLLIIGFILYFRRKEPTLEDKINAYHNMPVDDLYEDEEDQVTKEDGDQNMDLSPEKQEAKLALEDDPQEEHEIH